MNLKLIVIIFAGLAIGGASAIALLPNAQNALFPNTKTRSTGKALIGGAFTLVNHKGQTVTDKSYAKQYKLVYFGFTFCPDVCPAGLQTMTVALDKIGKPAASKIQPLFFTVDPERDTPAVMADYVASFYPTLVGLTGTLEQVKKAARAYRIYFAKVKNKDAPGDYTVDHSSFFYLMSPDGAFLRHFSHSVSPDVLAKALKALP